MKTSIATLLCAPLLVTGLAAQGALQENNPSKASSRRLVDVSVEGLVRGGAVSGGEIGLAGQPTGLTGPFDCLASIVDQATNACVLASSTPTFGMLCPYPGLNNSTIPQAFVGGGENNQAMGSWTMIGGGSFNTATGMHAMVAGGHFNTAAGDYATVAGGARNTAQAMYTTVSGGMENIAAGNRATIAGGWKNVASGGFAMIAGGRANSAAGNHSFAAGRRAKAEHEGSFVWGDAENIDKKSSAENQFNVYSSGGVRFVTRIGSLSGNPVAGVSLAPGASSWSTLSDRDSKENVEPVDGRAVLERLASVPLATWNYKAQDDSIRHMGPMAQDFHAAFGLGLGEKTIDTIDPDGVALAAIQGLNDLVNEKDAEIEELRARIERLEALAEAALAD